MIFERAVTLSVKKDLIVLQNVLLSVKSVVLILSKSFGLAFLIRVKQQLRCLLYAFLSICILMYFEIVSETRLPHDFFSYSFVNEATLVRFFFSKGSCF